MSAIRRSRSSRVGWGVLFVITVIVTLATGAGVLWDVAKGDVSMLWTAPFWMLSLAWLILGSRRRYRQGSFRSGSTHDKQDVQ